MKDKLDTISKKYLLLNENTGEMFPVTNKEALEILYRDELLEKQISKKDGYKKKMDKEEFKKYIDENLGSFYFNFYNLLLEKDLRPQDKFRFVYLCTYANYENILMKNNKTKLIKKDFEEILRLSRMETHRTLTNLKEKELIIEKGGIFMINENICVRGNLTKKQKSEEFARIFDEGIKELYEQASPKEHKLLNVFIKLLPYVNYNFNIVCKNPEETNKELVEPLGIKEMAEILGYSTPSRLKSDLLKMKIGGRSVIMITIVYKSTGIYINPRIYYKGNKRQSLEALEIMFNEE